MPSYWFLNTIIQWKELGLNEEMADSKAKTGKTKGERLSLDHLVVSESKDVLKENRSC